MYELRVRSDFSAAHRLAGYEGSCARLHGHNWEVEAGVRGRVLDDIGILVDFRRLREALSKIAAELDHQDLNEVGVLAGRNPTSETIARHVFEVLSRELNCEEYVVFEVKVREAAGASVTYRPDTVAAR